ncbi:DEAD/DEAH box helicase family protein [Diaphorobacter sp. HDW4A]|uniref:DEAD/DEAH box helicase family protein n=1 Tax=Diaphorobacter sp. HDW4A TaxID=2714924 RepID=UPI001407DE38|nr:DEAD/DEAH box helicase family protein [Diaphorobacter sp. HDW4A]QIL83408.1 DEAD/DEAH box helicase family protein [Diaphorobacter sp. HDW4A]
MSNFQFLHPEFRALLEPAVGAEQLVRLDPRAAVMRARHALERVVLWLYDNDNSLCMPYDKGLNTLLTQPDFARLVPPHVFDKMRLIQRQGNQAVHSGYVINSPEAIGMVRELFHVLYWLARTYTRMSDPKQMVAVWNERKLPVLLNADEAVQFTREELKRQDEKFQTQFAARAKELEAREEQLNAQATTLAEREAALARIDAELAERRAELARAKAAAIAVPDTHDYNETDTRHQFIDILLREAGWDASVNMGVEVVVPGMPNTQGEGAADYVLWAADGKPAAVVEAKRTFKDPEIGRQQAKLYADGLEAKYGQRPLIYYTNGHRTFFWDDTSAPPREAQGFHTRDELALIIERRSLRQDPRALAINNDIVERPYQHRAIRAMLEAMQQGRRRGLLTMATGTGKTRMAVALVDVLMRANLVKRVLFLADRKELVRQAAGAFKTFLADSSPVNLLLDKHGQGRVFVSTYPTMMGLIDELAGDQGRERRRYGVGFFDLVIVDEAHRSVYQKYGAIFRYFDSYLVGLTATPRDEVDRDTYHLFGLETGVPTDAYGLDEAVAGGYLVPPKAYDVPLKFVREGIKYDELSDEEKERWESTEWGDRADDDGDAPDEISASEINKQLFNESTVDLMLKHLMENGLKVDGGDKLGKTIIFAVNQKHADFIAQRFDHHYPRLKGDFARVITHAVTYAHTLIDDFKSPEKTPQIAISVDMLDTGIDVPEVLNLVYFKAVRSKVKFLQMIGRGTRLCKDLFGPGQDKSEFAIFDYCGNFEYFNEHPDGSKSSVAEPLGKRLFKSRIDLLVLLNERNTELMVAEPRVKYGDIDEPQSDAEVKFDLLKQLHGEVAAMNQDNFIVRTELEHVTRFADAKAWVQMSHSAFADLRNHVAGLPSEQEGEHITARLFDLLCVNLQLALIRQTSDWPKLQIRVMEIAADLETMQAVPSIKNELPLIQDVQSEEYWKDITLPMLERMRCRLRGLVKFIERKSIDVVYTVLQDEMGETTPVELKEYSTGINLAQYRRKVEAFIRANENHLAIAKLKHARPLTSTDLQQLELFFFSAPEVGGRERFTETYGEQSLPRFIRSLVGLDRVSAMDAFARFLDGSRYSSQQIRFVEMIIDRLTASGEMEPGQLYEPPFTAIHQHGLDGAFGDADANAVVEIVNELNRLAA